MKTLTTSEALRLVLDCVDYTVGNACSATEMVGAVLPKEVIQIAKRSLLVFGEWPAPKHKLPKTIKIRTGKIKL